MSTNILLIIIIVLLGLGVLLQFLQFLAILSIPDQLLGGLLDRTESLVDLDRPASEVSKHDRGFGKTKKSKKAQWILPNQVAHVGSEPSDSNQTDGATD
jgi:hypothetical protein